MSKGRLEAFSDGVFAIAITLLVLDLKVPQSVPLGGLWHALGQQWSAYFAYFVSFLVIGIIWLNHHSIFDKVRAVDRILLLANLTLLLFVSLIPFPTRLISEYLAHGPDAKTAVAISVLLCWAWGSPTVGFGSTSPLTAAFCTSISIAPPTAPRSDASASGASST